MSRSIIGYSFLNAEGAMVDIRKPNNRGPIYVCGFDSWDLFMDSRFMMCARVKEIKENQLATYEAVYQLSQPSTDYQEFLEISSYGNIPVVGNWNIYGSKEKGYYLTGDLFPQRKSLKAAKIISQEGNFLIVRQLIQIPTGEQIWDDPQKVFVCWNSMSQHAKAEIKARGRCADLEFAHFHSFNGKLCKPQIE